jgi:hypothetical protein
MATQGKQLLDYLLLPAIVVAVGVAAFGLGRLSALKENQKGIVITPAGATSSPEYGNHD